MRLTGNWIIWQLPMGVDIVQITYTAQKQSLPQLLTLRQTVENRNLLMKN